MTKPNIQFIVVGVGNIGSCWLEQFAPELPEVAGINLLVSSTRQLILQTERPGHDWRKQLAEQPPQSKADNAKRILERITALTSQQHPVVVVDLTADKAISRQYPHWIKAGAHLISANKHAGSSSLEHYQAIRDELSARQRFWLYNTTVGAGLPIQKAIQERRQCGDDIQAIHGVFSGSLSWIFRHFDAGKSQGKKQTKKFSEWLLEARQLGLTEPDPRLDLAGMDVARKLLILAREAGWDISLQDIQLDPLLPDELTDIPLAEFWQRLDELDSYIADKTSAGSDFCFVGSVERVATNNETGNGAGIKAAAKLIPLAADSPLSRIAPGDNYFQVFSQHYETTPLVIQGPGAGRTVTAAGVHSDVLELIRELT